MLGRNLTAYHSWLQTRAISCIIQNLLLRDRMTFCYVTEKQSVKVHFIFLFSLSEVQSWLALPHVTGDFLFGNLAPASTCLQPLPAGGSGAALSLGTAPPTQCQLPGRSIQDFTHKPLHSPFLFSIMSKISQFLVPTPLQGTFQAYSCSLLRFEWYSTSPSLGPARKRSGLLTTILPLTWPWEKLLPACPGSILPRKGVPMEVQCPPESAPLIMMTFFFKLGAF